MSYALSIRTAHLQFSFLWYKLIGYHFEPGVVFYYLARDGDDAAIFHFFKRYKGKKAFDEHNRQPICQKLLHEDKYIKDVQAKFVKPIRPRGQ
ncbi:hypothetical protein F5X99DRAFT_414794 [Biscogniauxia marginata]|nr:hypothetical protein F5X99DRAFT_414794 [Biscogniauxia marginata]